MISRCRLLASSSSSSSRLCRVLLAQNKTAVPCTTAVDQALAVQFRSVGLASSSSIPTTTTRRFFASDGSGNGNDDDDKNKDGGDAFEQNLENLKGWGDDEEEEDPFGVEFDDGDGVGKFGTSLPPEYKRDSATGKLTGDVRIAISDEERELLRANPAEREKLLLRRVVESWKESSAAASSGFGESLHSFARRVRFTNLGLTVLGRSVPAQKSTAILDDGTTLDGGDNDVDGVKLSQALTPNEFKAFQRYMEHEHKVTNITEDDVMTAPRIATQRNSGGGRGFGDEDDSNLEDPDNPDLSLKWMTKRAQWEMTRTGYENENDPFADMLPSELTPKRLVCRKRAKRLPKELLHHNNLSLLRRYITPTGQIMDRIQSRLGARDQRKIAKLIKRARCLGLIPNQGQWVVEEHGDIYEKDIEKDTWWEKELKQRGLVVDCTKRPEPNPYLEDIGLVEKELRRRGFSGPRSFTDK